MIGLRRRLRGRLGAALVLLSATLMTACHTYTPVSAPPPGSTVRVHIPVRSAMDDPNAPEPTRTVEGVVLAASDTLVLATQSRYEYGAYREIVQYDTLRLGPDQRSGMELREFSSRKSVVLGLALTGIVAGAAVLALGGKFGTEGEGPPDDGPTTSIIGIPLGTLLGWLPGN